jgi:hypothetical protein
MAGVGIVVPDGIFNSLEGAIGGGATDAIVNGGGAVVNEAFALGVANTGAMAGAAATAMLTNAVLPGIGAAALLGHVVARNNINHVLGYVNSAGRSTRRFASMTAAVMDSKGKVDLKKMEEVKNWDVSRLNAELGETPVKRIPFLLRIKSGFEEAGLTLRAGFNAQKKEEMRGTAHMPASRKLYNILKENRSIRCNNDAKRIETATKLVKGLGNAGVEGAVSSLLDFAKSEAFQSIADRVFEVATSEKAEKAISSLAKTGTKGAVEGALDTFEQQKDKTGKILENTLNSAHDARLDTVKDGAKVQAHSAPSLAKLGANGLYQPVTDGVLAASSLLGASATAGFYAATGLSSVTTGVAAATSLPLALFAMSAPAIEARNKTGEMPYYELADKLLPFVSPAGKAMYKATDVAKALPSDIERSNNNTKAATLAAGAIAGLAPYLAGSSPAVALASGAIAAVGALKLGNYIQQNITAEQQ